MGTGVVGESNSKSAYWHEVLPFLGGKELSEYESRKHRFRSAYFVELRKLEKDGP